MSRPPVTPAAILPAPPTSPLGPEARPPEADALLARVHLGRIARPRAERAGAGPEVAPVAPAQARHASLVTASSDGSGNRLDVLPPPSVCVPTPARVPPGTWSKP